MKTKTCTKCKIEKSISDFYKDQNTEDKYRSYCKECIANYGKKYRQKNLKEDKERKKKYYQDNTEKIKAEQKKWRLKNPTYHKKYYSLNKKQCTK